MLDGLCVIKSGGLNTHSVNEFIHKNNEIQKVQILRKAIEMWFRFRVFMVGFLFLLVPIFFYFWYMGPNMMTLSIFSIIIFTQSEVIIQMEFMLSFLGNV
jgi:hypothetical protein